MHFRGSNHPIASPGKEEEKNFCAVVVSGRGVQSKDFCTLQASPSELVRSAIVALVVLREFFILHREKTEVVML